MDFIIDTTGTGDISVLKQPGTSTVTTEAVRNDIIQKLLNKHENALEPANLNSINSSKIEKRSVVAKFSDEMGWTRKKKEVERRDTGLTHNYDVDELLKKSVITPDFEKLQVVPAMEISKKKLKEMRSKEREKTKGKNWNYLPATELTDEIKTDLEIIKMRSVLDPKHFYKKNDLDVLPKYFQIGKVLDSPLEHYNNRLTKKERKRTLVDELLADAEFNKYNKRKYQEIIQEKQKTHYKAYRKAKKLKRKHKK
ncbi:hypothetical protein MML48_7g00013536 [Holotrichia oblita]|uniref:Uncharacterized protein n=1 Tax=Holotrichia oblita TaxID=644536 RepID=A0ACB9SW52_HOLOL|nr:hypothetical protein MML48_7g00013536 [Holotrichia oblita]